MTTFNLVSQPWLPALPVTGGKAEYSLRELFEQAHTLRDLSAANPLTEAALCRLLLAVLHRAYRGPTTGKAWQALWQMGQFDATIPAYLAAQAEHFDLFSVTRPFYQTAGFTTDGEPTPVSKLLHELACATNKTLFDHTLDDQPPRLSPAEAARALITFQGYALGGGKSAASQTFGAHPYFGNAPLNQGALVFIKGENLFQTLLLNAVYYDPTQPNRPIPRDFDREDLPVWERDATRRKPGDYPQAGYLDYLTWMSRHVRLLPDPDGETVSWCYLAQGEKLPAAKEGQGPTVRDPFCAFRTNKDGLTFPIKLQEDKALWRDSGSLFAWKEETHASGTLRHAHEVAEYLDDLELRCAVIGLANDQANPLLWRQEVLPLSLALLREGQVVAYIERALEWCEELGFLLREQVKALAGEILTNGGRTPDAGQASKFAKNLGAEARYWAELEPLFHRYLDEMPKATDRDQRVRQWEKDTADIAINTFNKTTENALGYRARELRARVVVGDRFKAIVTNKLNKHQP